MGIHMKYTGAIVGTRRVCVGMIEAMSETAEPETTPTPTTEPTPPRPVDRGVPDRRQSSRLFQALAWVGIAAGSVFIVAVVFFSGFFIGKHSGPGFDHLRGPGGVHMLHRGGPPPLGPPGEWPGPGRMGPGQMGPGGPTNSPTPTTAATPRP